MDDYDRTIGAIDGIDLSVAEMLASVGHRTLNFLEGLNTTVAKYKRTKNVSIIRDFLKDCTNSSVARIETVDDDSLKENEKNNPNIQVTTPKGKPNKESMRPLRKAQLKSTTEQQGNKGRSIQIVKTERLSSEQSTVDDDSVFYDAPLGVKTESEEMPPPAEPARRRGRPKKEKTSVTEAKVKKEKKSVTEVKEKKQSTRGRKKTVESISRDSDVIYQPNDIQVIDIDSEEDVNRNSVVSDVESVDGDGISKRATMAKTSKNISSKLKSSKKTTRAEKQGEKSVKANLEKFARKQLKSEEQSELKNATDSKQIEEPEKQKNSDSPRLTTAAINTQTDTLKETPENNPGDGEAEIPNNQITEELVEVKNTKMKVKPPRTNKTKVKTASESEEVMNTVQNNSKAKAASESKEAVDTAQTTVQNKTKAKAGSESEEAVYSVQTNVINTNTDSTFAITNSSTETNTANSTFAVINNGTETNPANSTVAVNKQGDTNVANATFAVTNKNTDTNAGNNNMNTDVNGTFVTGNNNSPQVNGTFLVDSDQILRQNLNETHVIPNKFNETHVKNNKPPINSIVDIEKLISPVRKTTSGSVYEDALEQIQSEVKVNKGAVKKQINKGPKPVFSPFANSPVKKRVEAFEKLRAETALDSQTRMTRTKTRNKAKAQQEQQDSNKKSQIPIPDTVTRNNTPSLTNRYLPSNANYYSCKAVRSHMYTPTPPTKTMSALKASQQEFREREQRRREKEEEALRKKEQLLKAQMEEKKRKREERECKAKQQRDAQERDKKKLLELQAQKEEKLKRLQVEKQEKLVKIREEAEKKRQLVKQRLEEKRRQDENEKRLLATLRGDDDQKTPLYMTTKPPLLPTFDCYDSDDEEGQKKTASTRKPDWLRSEQIKNTLTYMDYVDNKLKNTLFFLKAQTANLREVFEIIDPKKLQRNSSAIWKHPPRFTLMPTLRNSDDGGDGLVFMF